MPKKLLYFCSYVPYETLTEYGYDMVSAYDLPVSGTENGVFQNRLCSFSAMCAGIRFEDYDGVVFTNCCNSMQKLYDHVRYHRPGLPVFLLELSYTAGEYRNLPELFRWLGVPARCAASGVTPALVPEEAAGAVAVFSSALSREYRSQLPALFPHERLYVETCADMPRGDLLLRGQQVSCPRMLDYAVRMDSVLGAAKAAVFLTSQRCDYSMFSYPHFLTACEDRDLPRLHLEEGYTGVISERSKIRYEAFCECLEQRAARQEESQ